MCRCCCGVEGYHPYREHKCGHTYFPWQIMDVEEEIKMLEEYREALTRSLEKVNKRLEALKRR
jgi:tetrahydromethanopterin S-methyltransferase subunit B